MAVCAGMVIRLGGVKTKEEEQLVVVRRVNAVGLGTSRVMMTFIGDPMDLATNGFILT